MIKVVKFGGSSLADAVQIKKAGKIVLSEESRRYVVPSAPGKRFSDDTKVTDMLYRCYGAAVKEKKFTELLADIQKRYQEIIEGLGITLSLDEEFATIRDNFAKKIGRDYAASRGEYLNGRVIAAYLGYEFIDAAEVIKFDENGNFLSEETNQVLADRLSKVERAVIPGFYGARPDGTIQTFSRGGSDVTGSIVARATHADMYENWTDVSGFLIADPRIIKNPKGIEAITYKELRELSYMGASVLHEDAIFPVRKEGIPINIRNTNAPEEKGTLIVEGTCRKPKYTITGILEKLVSAGFLERKKSRKTVHLLPSHDAVSLITVLPEQLQSPLLTAEWEYRLGEIERGQLAPEEFLDGISTMLKDLVGTYQVIKGTEYLFAPPREVVGKCPRCGGEVAELQKGFFCQNDSCKFAIWKNNKWWAAKKKQPTKAVVSALLNDGRVRVTGLYSEKTGKTYDATVILEDNGQYANFKLEFDQRKGGSR